VETVLCCNLNDLPFEKTERVGIGDHQRGNVVVHGAAQGCNLDQANAVALHLYGAVSAQGGARRVGAVRAGWDQHLAARPPTIDVVGANHLHAGEFTLCAGGGLQTHGIHAADLGQQPLEVPDQLQRALRGVIGRQRV
jgi:hypothetical protein